MQSQNFIPNAESPANSGQNRGGAKTFAITRHKTTLKRTQVWPIIFGVRPTLDDCLQKLDLHHLHRLGSQGSGNLKMGVRSRGKPGVNLKAEPIGPGLRWSSAK
jgi:hypothetical protein